MQSLKIFPMSFADLKEVVEIERRSFPHPWSRAQFRRELINPISFSFAGKVEYKGRLRLVSYIVFWLVSGEGHILNVAVHPDFRHRGIARELITFALCNMEEMGAHDLFLEVRLSNNVAIHLYESLGFREIGIRKGYYENGEDAKVMHYGIRPFEYRC
ncbi:MAG: ribosomal protein S18-alanine N-acetyltransferase [Thermodesulfobacteriota bacterium]